MCLAGYLHIDIRSFGGMGEGADGDEVDAFSCIVLNVLQSNSSRELYACAIGDQLDRIIDFIQWPVIQHDDVYFLGEGFLEFLVRADLDFDQGVFLAMLEGALNGVCHAACHIHVVVLYQVAIVQAHTMVGAASGKPIKDMEAYRKSLSR